MTSRNKATPRPPLHLSPKARKLWRDILDVWDFSPAEPAALAILATGLESFDRCAMARRTLEAEGLSVKDRFGVPRVHPLCAVARDAEAAFRSAMRQLGIDKSPPEEQRRPGRPSALKGM